MAVGQRIRPGQTGSAIRVDNVPVSPADQVRLEILLRLVVGLLSLGAAAVHAVVIESHFAEYWLFGVFFALLALLQGGWAVAVVFRPSRRLLIWGAVGNGIVVAVWLVTRTLGLPLGPEAGSTEAVGFVDTAATVFEVLLVAGVAALVSPRVANRSIPREFVPAGALAVGAMVAIVTRDAVLAARADLAGEAAEAVNVSRVLAGHVPHLVLIGAAVATFVAYVLVDVWRHGRPTFSRNARSR
jgi:hypothetical protein